MISVNSSLQIIFGKGRYNLRDAVAVMLKVKQSNVHSYLSFFPDCAMPVMLKVKQCNVHWCSPM